MKRTYKVFCKNVYQYCYSKETALDARRKMQEFGFTHIHIKMKKRLEYDSSSN